MDRLVCDWVESCVVDGSLLGFCVFVYGRMYRWKEEWMEKVCTSVSNLTRCRSEFVTLDPKLVRTLDGMLFY
jgi:hypothetical protein